MDQVTPVILCGGSGTRLWPLSRKAFPKQFTRLVGENSLFQDCALRLRGPGLTPPMVLTNSDFRFLVTEQLQAAGIDPGPVLIEPEGRNTAPAVLAASLFALASDPDAILLVAPSDHVVPDAAAFRAAVQTGLTAVKQKGHMVTFGITPDRPESGYGYLQLEAPPDGNHRTVPLTRFVEKPDSDTAAKLIAEGNYLWNSGIFLFAARDMIAAFEIHAPDLIGPVKAAVETAKPDLGFLRLNASAWKNVREVSIDYAVMDKSDALSVVPFDGAWSDLGGWDAVYRTGAPDGSGVVTNGPAQAIDCTNTLLRSEDSDMELVGIGLDNIMAIATTDAVLVADLDRAQDVKHAVRLLNEKGARQAETFPMDHRPWGQYQVLALANRFQVKRIVVNPGAALSLQSHVHRAEHWVVVEGTAMVTIGETEKLLGENESIYVPLGAVHRLANPGKVPMVLVEVQTGSYLGEDDIIRYDDVYARE